jgi:pimeloyl-ACP methyl ester carboxylesterase
VSAASATPDGSITGRFDVGGRSLFLECRGTGSPSVIFLVGTGAPRTQLRSLEKRVLAQSARVCDYDRAGDGQSDPAPAPQSDLDIVGDLAALLAAAHVPKPYVLVGQSVGGDQAWLYAGKHPAGVAGFLIMNAGFFVLDWNAVKSVWSDQEIADEQAASKAGLGTVKQASSPRRGVPYVVMLSTVAQCASTTDVCGRIYPFYEAWAREIASRTPDGRFVSVSAGHEIYQGDMAAVMSEIDRLLREVR